jgi:hypothetical protein
MSVSVIEQLQGAVYRRLLDDEWLAEVSILTEDKGDILADVTQALGTFNKRSNKIGACVIVLAPSASMMPGSSPGSPMDINISVRVLEEPMTNRGARGTGKGVLDIGNWVARLMEGFSAFDLCNPLVPESPTIVPVADPLAPRALEIRFQTSELHFGSATKTRDVSLAYNSGTGLVTATSATSGASIYYTTDESFPGKNSTLYTAPFAVTPPATVKACAFKAGMIGSNVSGISVNS